MRPNLATGASTTGLRVASLLAFLGAFVAGGPLLRAQDAPRSYAVQPAFFPGALDPGEPGSATRALNDDILNNLDPGEPTAGNTADFESRLRAIEERLRRDQNSASPDGIADGDKAAADRKKPAYKLAARLQIDYWGFPNTSPGADAFENGNASESIQDRFLLRRLRIGAAGDIAENVVFRFDVDFGSPNSPQLKDCFIGMEELPILQTLLVGNQKRPYSLDSINSTNVNLFMERPAVIDAFNPDYRRFGAQSWGFSSDLTYNWRYGVFLGQDLASLGTIFATPVNEDLQGEVAGRLASTWWYDESSDGRGYGHWAVAAAVASPDGDDPVNNTARFRSRPEARTTERWLDTGPIAGAHTYELIGLEALLNLGPFQAVSEYQQVWVQRDGSDEVTFLGAYGYLSYFLTGEHIPWDRETGQLGRVKPFENFFLVRQQDGGVCSGLGAWEVCIRYSYCDLTDGDIAGGVSSEVTLGLNWYWNEWSRMQFNYVHGTIIDHEPVDGYTDADFDILGMRLAMFF